ncbi:MAG TPA: phasin family protein [Xanthobacteraceae bacterium]|nr:phasin family protein [Xanthobacteraceae bacterium]
MAKDPMSSFEIPAEMRRLAEMSVTQARQVFDGFLSAAQQAVSRVEGQAAAAQAGAADMSRKAMAFAGQNMAASFAFVQKLAQAKDAEDVMRLQADFVRAQMQAFAEQARDLGASFTQAAADATKREP